MNIRDLTFTPTSFEAFADTHGLILELRERPCPLTSWLPRYYASFKDVEVSELGTLVSVHGDGETPEAAIREYARRLLGQRIVLSAYTPTRREIQCPNEWLASEVAR